VGIFFLTKLEPRPAKGTELSISVDLPLGGSLNNLFWLKDVDGADFGLEDNDFGRFLRFL